MNPWRTRINQWLHPVASKLPISPNALTGLALGLNLVAASTLAQSARRPSALLVATGLLAVGGLLDALDGAVARAQGKTSRIGDFLDHLSDRVSDGALLAGWTIGAEIRLPLAVLTLLAVSLNGYIGTQMEASFGKRDYDAVGRGEFVLGLIVMPIVLFTLHRSQLAHHRFLTLTIAEWMTVAILVAAVLGFLQRLAQVRRLPTA
ncbi:MAG TPA: CDP-alcohol phosphatidyltransferase family protein [Thermoanaerobaculia bacterium]|nr:CDP-alcohol phosphatidyltransferase family protein [Thermoanaerobaculia bacterium]